MKGFASWPWQKTARRRGRSFWTSPHAFLSSTTIPFCVSSRASISPRHTPSIDTACDGVAARTRLGQAPYDILLLDIEMPQLDGLSLLNEIRSDERLRHLPVIMLTGHDDIASIDRAYHIGADAFATKPVNWRQLSYQIRYVLRTSRLERLQNEHARLRKRCASKVACSRPQPKAMSAIFWRPSFIRRIRSRRPCRSSNARSGRKPSRASARARHKLLPKVPDTRRCPRATTRQGQLLRRSRHRCSQTEV